MKIQLEKENAFCYDDLMYDLEKAKIPYEIECLEAFNKECTDNWGEEWTKYGLTLINENDWDEYAGDLFDEMVTDEFARRYADYEKFARDLKYDYTPVTLNNTTFWGLSS